MSGLLTATPPLVTEMLIEQWQNMKAASKVGFIAGNPAEDKGTTKLGMVTGGIVLLRQGSIHMTVWVQCTFWP